MTVWGMYVDPAARGRGVGRRLLADAVERARRVDGVRQVHLSATVGNDGAVCLYESLGFVTWGIEPASMTLEGVDLDEAHMVLYLDARSRPDP